MVGTLVPSLNGRSCNDKDGDLNSYLGSEFINLPSGQLVTSFFFLKKICLLIFFLFTYFTWLLWVLVVALRIFHHGAQTL